MLSGDLNGKEIQKREDICTHLADSQQTLTQHCKATILQQKLIKKSRQEILPSQEIWSQDVRSISHECKTA